MTDLSPQANHTLPLTAPVVIRPLDGADRDEVEQLAERDSGWAPAEPLLGAESDGRLLAALSLADGEVVADPFHRTAELVTLLRVRAGQLLPPLS